jgi:outer membrane protein OmpA-like peptidoglycan-associated protein
VGRGRRSGAGRASGVCRQPAGGGRERQRIQLDARTRETEAARQAAAEAQRQAEELQRQLAELLQARETERGLVLTLGDILFDVDRAELNPGGEQQVTRVADFLREFPDRQVLIEGHTDSTGSAEYNRQLSQRRAASVEHFLISQGVDARRIDIRGYGRDYPVASNDTGAGRQQNRRVEIVILKQGMTDAPRPAAGPI